MVLMFIPMFSGTSNPMVPTENTYAHLYWCIFKMAVTIGPIDFVNFWWKTSKYVVGLSQTYIVSLLSEQCVVVRRGDRLGVYSERRQSPVAYIFNDRNPRALVRSFSNYSHPVEPGDIVAFDPLVFPYAFSAAVYYYVLGNNNNNNLYIYNNRIVKMCGLARGLRGRTDGRATTVLCLVSVSIKRFGRCVPLRPSGNFIYGMSFSVLKRWRYWLLCMYKVWTNLPNLCTSLKDIISIDLRYFITLSVRVCQVFH